MTFRTLDIVKASFLGLIFILTLISNSFVGLILIKNRKTLLKHATYRFVLNIVVSDLLLAVLTMPFEFTRELKNEWIFGSVPCKLIEYVEIVVGGTAIMSHAFVAIDRYRSVVHPHLPKLRPNVTKCMIVASWILPACVSAPYLYMFEVTRINSREVCTPFALAIDWLDKFYEGVEFSLLYALPLAIICWCYYYVVWAMWLHGTRTNPDEEVEIPRTQLVVWKNKKKVTKSAGIVVGAFLICWSPTFVLSVWRIAAGTESIHHGTTLHEIAMFAAFVSEALNPILYCSFDTNFKDSVRQMFVGMASAGTTDDENEMTEAERNPRRNTIGGN